MFKSKLLNKFDEIEHGFFNSKEVSPKEFMKV